MSAKRVSTRRTRLALVAAGLGAALALGAGTSAAFADEANSALTGTAQLVAAQAKAQAQAATTAAKPAAAKPAATWNKPVASYTLSATFAQAGGLWAHKHSGQDFACPIGTPVHAASAGVVVKAGPNGGGDGPAYGNAIVIRHANNTYSQYAHLSRIQVRIGQKVAMGAQIGLSGNTGNSTGPHLHFEIRTTPNYGSAVNPVAFLRKVGITV